MQGFMGEVAKETPIRDRIRDWVREFLDRHLHKRCLPPRNYPLSHAYKQKARSDVAVHVAAGWPIEFDDIEALRKRATDVGMEEAVREWIDRRADKVRLQYKTRALLGFRDLGVLDE